MSAATQQARAEFVIALKDSRDLIWLHQHSQTGPGRRHRQPTLNRAVIVIAAAAWQAYVQDTTEAILSGIAVPAGQPGHSLYLLIRATTKTALGRFNTPNARNTLSLFNNVGFDPEPSWHFSIGAPPRVYAAKDVRDEIDGWLDVRHKIAHGAPLPATNFVSGRPQSGPSLHRRDAERCIDFFDKVAEITAQLAHQQFP